VACNTEIGTTVGAVYDRAYSGFEDKRAVIDRVYRNHPVSN